MAAAAESTALKLAYDDKYACKLASGINLKCTPCPVYGNFFNKFETDIPEMEYKYQVCQVKGFVKWQVDGAAGPTHAQLLIRRLGKEQFSLKSQDPWKKPVQFPVATFVSDSPSKKEEITEFDVTETADALHSFWKPGKQGRYTFLQNCIRNGPPIFVIVR